MTTPTPTGE
jgi:hypothetical protein